MEPDKIEKHIKSKLDEREINPSDNAWNTIADQLETSDAPKSKKFFWYGIAAGFIGILIISSIYFGYQNEPFKSGIEVVDAAKEPKEPINIQSIKKVVEQNSLEDKMVDSQKEVNKAIKKPQAKDEVIAIANSKTTAAEKVNDKVIKVNEEPIETEQLIYDKIAGIVAQVEVMETNDLSVSDAEVDSLLRKAQQEILTSKIFNKEGKVDAVVLLNEVEGELDQTFREQIFKSLKEGFLKVRTAVADRNN